MTLVVDASVALAWLFEGEATPYSEAALSHVRDSGSIVPSIWPLEVANALITGERRSRLTVAQTAQALNVLRPLPIQIVEIGVETAWQEVIRLSREFRLTVYDASYIDLALRYGAPLASLDHRMRAAAERAGVLLLPGSPA